VPPAAIRSTEMLCALMDFLEGYLAMS